MLRSQKKSNYEKLLFKSYYCANCQQQKSCDQLAEGKNYCCPCYSQEILEELEQEGLLISSAQQKLNNYRSGVIACQYSEVEKPRIKYISYDGNG
jgi:hypothetical protein